MLKKTRICTGLATVVVSLVACFAPGSPFFSNADDYASTTPFEILIAIALLLAFLSVAILAIENHLRKAGHREQQH